MPRPSQRQPPIARPAVGASKHVPGPATGIGRGGLAPIGLPRRDRPGRQDGACLGWWAWGDRRVSITPRLDRLPNQVTVIMGEKNHRQWYSATWAYLQSKEHSKERGANYRLERRGPIGVPE